MFTCKVKAYDFDGKRRSVQTAAEIAQKKYPDMYMEYGGMEGSSKEDAKYVFRFRKGDRYPTTPARFR